MSDKAVKDMGAAAENRRADAHHRSCPPLTAASRSALMPSDRRIERRCRPPSDFIEQRLGAQEQRALAPRNRAPVRGSP